MSKNSGPAFPQHYGDKPTGMSRRDYFAAHALVGLIAAYAGPESSLPASGWAAKGAYEYADAMIEESAK